MNEEEERRIVAAAKGAAMTVIGFVAAATAMVILATMGFVDLAVGLPVNGFVSGWLFCALFLVCSLSATWQARKEFARASGGRANAHHGSTTAQEETA